MKQLSRFLFLTLPFYTIHVAFGQNVMFTPQVIASGGNFAVGHNLTFSQTIGEMSMVSTLQSSSMIVTQGFQQPDLKNTIQPENPCQDFYVKDVYPNPASEQASLEYRFCEAGKLYVGVYDMLGQLVAKETIVNYSGGGQAIPIQTNYLAQAVYFVNIRFVSASGKESNHSKKIEVVH